MTHPGTAHPQAYDWDHGASDSAAAYPGAAAVAAAPAPPRSTPLMTVPTMPLGQDLAGGHEGISLTVYMSTAVNPVDQLAGRDYDRLEARIMAVGQPVVICHTKENAENVAAAAAAAGGISLTAGAPLPGGWLPAGSERTLRNGDEIWIAATAAAGGMVVLTVSRRLPVVLPAHS